MAFQPAAAEPTTPMSGAVKHESLVPCCIIVNKHVLEVCLSGLWPPHTMLILERPCRHQLYVYPCIERVTIDNLFQLQLDCCHDECPLANALICVLLLRNMSKRLL